ncbi:MAG: small ribosomal subunit biogenesis GTPase RsgA [Porticoccus sp.]
MTKRHLTKQQRRRIEQNQAKTGSQTDARQEADEQISSTTLGPEKNGRVIARYSHQVDIEPEQPTTNQADYQICHDIHRCHLRANLPSIVTGDQVTWRQGETRGVVIARHSRSSELCRPDNRGKLRPVAANIDRIAIVIAPYPEPHANLIDRYLVAAEYQAIQPMLILNKADLIDDSNRLFLDQLLDGYTKLGYHCQKVSAHTSEGMDSLADYLKTLTSIFVGQSGVGKSSLLNTLSPEIHLAVGALSAAKAKGTHTTTTSRLFHLPNGGDVIDSPGIREFGLWHLEPESIAQGFVEFRPFLGSCKFRDCKHKQEPGCILRQAVDDGTIGQERFDSYWHILHSLEQDQ